VSAHAYRKAARFGAWLLSAIVLVSFWQWYTKKFGVIRGHDTYPPNFWR
jgi:hypothetical protein